MKGKDKDLGGNKSNFDYLRKIFFRVLQSI